MSADAPRPDADDGEPPDIGRRVVAVAVVVAALLVVAAATALALDRRTGGDAGPTSSTTTVADLVADQQSGAADFLADWHAWRSIDVVVRSTFVRERADGEQLTSDMVLAQQGDRRLVSRLGGAEGYVDDQRVRCVSESDGTYRCDRTPTGATAEQRRRDELDTWAEYLSGVPPYYRILTLDGGCYELVLTRALPGADFGSVAEFCFDEASGALVRTRIQYANGLVETTEAVVIETEVDAAIFEALQTEPVGG